MSVSTRARSALRGRGSAAWLKWLGFAAVVLVPLAFAGLFVGALSKADTAIDRIPAAIVNNDTLVYTTAPDGTQSPVFAGRQLVTDLTGGSEGFDWLVTNAARRRPSLRATYMPCSRFRMTFHNRFCHSSRARRLAQTLRSRPTTRTAT